MRPPLKIVLIGMPGSGKSTFGRMVARELNFVFIDLDHLIEKGEGRLIKDIFEEEGEGKFREMETYYLNQALDNVEGFVLSTGGGTPCFNDNMDLINEKGISVFLDVPLEELQKRLTKDSASQRPLFFGMNTGEITLKLKDMMAIRGSYYDQAKIKLSGEDPSTELLISELMSFFKN
ncbi:shikimate kinase [Belliella baltica DSM 15883]|uniref:Shikimate kinase n=1 Tax=Belliella baltica (strain DSM 15883 / CIP 108006 / LMG 21964 / BA134) TaxID=866536 RepID=I3Z0R0_BELBD|nr:shikimate kinase [Belliella baltica]AFL82828.1 shikimate kinase [Belliella baltica DSM 15883]